MSDPVVFISRFRVKENKLEALRGFLRDGVAQLEREKPGTVVFLPYLSEDGTEATIVHAFPDASAMDVHFQGSGQRSQAASEFLEPAGFEVYGNASEEAVAMLREASLIHQPHHLGGFLRLAPAPSP